MPTEFARRSAIALLVLALGANAAHAQFGASLGFRSMNSEEEFLANSDRRGYEARGTYDGEFGDGSGLFAWRAELAFAQMQFQRDDGSETFQVSENGFELIPTLRFVARRGAFTGFYGTVGPVASYRAVCGSSGRFDSNGRVACDEGETYRTGYALGVGLVRPFTPNRELMIEARFMGGTTAAAGRQLLALSVGLRAR